MLKTFCIMYFERSHDLGSVLISLNELKCVNEIYV